MHFRLLSKNDYYLKQDKRGLILVKTQSMLIVATYTENMFPSVCVEAVEKLGNPPYLKYP